MTAPDARPGGLDSNMRGLVVLVVAVLVGVLLLANAGSGDSGSTKTTSSTPPTTGSLSTDDTTGSSSATTSTTAAASGRQPSEVTVIVLNGGGPAGSAGSTTNTIGDAGYTTLKATNVPAGSNVDATTVYYAKDYKAEGTAIALLLGKSTDVVKPLSEASLGTAAGDANVVVVLGPDTAPVSDGSTTTTAAGSTTTTN